MDGPNRTDSNRVQRNVFDHDAEKKGYAPDRDGRCAVKLLGRPISFSILNAVRRSA